MCKKRWIKRARGLQRGRFYEGTGGAGGYLGFVPSDAELKLFNGDPLRMKATTGHPLVFSL